MAPARRVQGPPTLAGVGSPPRRRNAEIDRSRLAPVGFGRRAAICFVVAPPRSDGHVRRDASHLAARRSERTSPYLWSGVLRLPPLLELSPGLPERDVEGVVPGKEPDDGELADADAFPERPETGIARLDREASVQSVDCLPTVAGVDPDLTEVDVMLDVEELAFQGQ